MPASVRLPVVKGPLERVPSHQPRTSAPSRRRSRWATTSMSKPAAVTNIALDPVLVSGSVSERPPVFEPGAAANGGGLDESAVGPAEVLS
jgi:hypothetical protein